MARRDPADVIRGLPRWQQAMTRYLGLDPGAGPTPRPTWLRVIAGVAAALMLLAVVMAVATGHWFDAVVRLLMALLFAFLTRPTRWNPVG